MNKSIRLFLFTLLLLASFFVFNFGSSLLWQNKYYDFTSDKRLTLSPATQKMLAEIKDPLFFRLYISPSLPEQMPRLAQYSEYVVQLLEQYRTASKGMINFDIRRPQPFSSIAKEARKLGLKSFSSPDGKSELWFGALAFTDRGRSRTIPAFADLRRHYLESDLNRIILSLEKNPARPKIGIISPDLPLGNPRQKTIKSGESWNIINQLEKDYRLEAISGQAVQIGADINTLIYVNPSSNISKLNLYALDQFVLRGGNLIMFVDALDENTGKQNADENLNYLLNNWGVSFSAKEVIGDKNNSEEAIINKQSRQYYPWLNIPAKEINQDNAITSDLDNLIFRSPAAIYVSEKDGIKAVPLATTSAAGGSVLTKIAALPDKNAVFRHYKDTGERYNLIVELSGKFSSVFTDNIMNGTPYSAKMLTYLPESLKPGHVVIIGDTDFLYDANWSDSSYTEGNPVFGIVPWAGNGDFLRNAVDYLSGNNLYLGFPHGRLLPQDSLYRIFFSEAEIPYLNVRQNQIRNQEQAAQIRDTLSKQAENKPLTLNQMKQLEEANTRFTDAGNILNEYNYRIERKTSQKIRNFIILNAAASLLLMFAVIFIIRRKLKKRRRCILSEGKNV